ncbi:MAG: ABC transporter permease [Clostridium sp.]
MKNIKSKFKNIQDKLIPLIFTCLLLTIWEIIVNIGGIPDYILPKPSEIFGTLVNQIDVLMPHIMATLYEGVVGFIIAIFAALFLAVIMDLVPLIKKALYPVLVISQTVPIIALAPLFIIWFGFGTLPKIIVVVLVCFFPIVISITNGIESVDKDLENHFQLMGASKIQRFIHLKLPYGMISFFSGLKIAATYSIMGAVVGEWLGGDKGLGVYMVRARGSYALDKMFAAILVIVILSIVIFYLVGLIEKVAMPWNVERRNKI